MLNPDLVVCIQALAGAVLCPWVRHFTLAVSLFTQVFIEWVITNLLLGGKPVIDQHPIQSGVEIVLVNSGLLNHCQILIQHQSTHVLSNLCFTGKLFFFIIYNSKVSTTLVNVHKDANINSSLTIINQIFTFPKNTIIFFFKLQLKPHIQGVCICHVLVPGMNAYATQQLLKTTFTQLDSLLT